MPVARLSLITDQMVKKPARTLGAPFISDYVARGGNVLLCEVCWRKYYGWWRRYDYRPNWDMRFCSHCDGCSAEMVPCVHFVPDLRFYLTYTESHGRYPEPNRKIYSI